MSHEKRALVLVMSLAQNDPRVRRQLTWLKSDGWTIDTIGIGPTPSDEVSAHFAIGEQRAWVRTRWGVLISYLLLSKRAMFRRVVVDRIPPEGLKLIAAGEYDLVLFNDFDFLPLVKDPKIFTAPALAAHLHADVHEYRDRKRRVTLWRWITRRFYSYQRETLGDKAFDTRSTVARRIAEFYAQDFEIEEPMLVRNIPPFHDQRPSSVDDSEVRMLFHGLASNERGFREIFHAMRTLDERFTMTFMLTGNPAVVNYVREQGLEFGERVKVVPPVPMTELSATVNQYDIEIIFYPPIKRNIEFSLPNKFFEAIQGRLAIVVGQSPMMAELVEKYEVGVVASGWSGDDLAAAINALTTEQIEQFKANTDHAARELNAEVEGESFLATLRRTRHEVDKGQR